MIDKIKDSIKEGRKEDNIILYGMNNRGGVSSASPFVGKIELYLRMNNIPYEVEEVKSFNKAPKKKVPYIKHGDNIIADSTFIIKYLKETYKNDIIINDVESPLRRGAVKAARIMAEEHLYFAMLSIFFLTKEGWDEISSYYKKVMPKFVSLIFLYVLHPLIKKSLYSQGMGRHSKNDIMQLIREDYQMLSDILGENDYFGGDVICEDDASLFFYVDTLIVGFGSIFPDESIQKHPNLKAYHERIKNAYFPDNNPTKFKKQT